MKDLENAILDVIESANYNDKGFTSVRYNALVTLQAEYNIHFIEPDYDQLDVL
jgi:hypothetical protein